MVDRCRMNDDRPLLCAHSLVAAAASSALTLAEILGRVSRTCEGGTRVVAAAPVAHLDRGG